MPKRKTGQRKKAEKQKERQQGIRQAHLERPLAERPCNATMVRWLFHDYTSSELTWCRSESVTIRSFTVRLNNGPHRTPELWVRTIRGRVAKHYVKIWTYTNI